MPAGSRAERARSLFQDALLVAITDGRIPSACSELSDRTWSSIEAVARAHPDATPSLISAAYDSFESDCDDVARKMANR